MNEKKDRYWKIIGLGVLVGFFGCVPLALVLVVNKSLWPLVLVGFVLLYGIGAPLWIRWFTKNTVCICSKCGSTFEPSVLQVIFSPGGGISGYLQCPECKKFSWCEYGPKPEE